MMIEIGKVKDKKIFLDLEKAENGHILIVGKSGTGKTYKINSLIPGLAAEGATVIILDYSGSFSVDQWNYDLCSVDDKIEIVDVRSDKIPINPLEPLIRSDGTVENNIDVALRFTEMVSDIYRLGLCQKATLYTAMNELMNLKNVEANMTNLNRYLRQDEDNTRAVSLLGKLAPIFDYKIFADRNRLSLETGKIVLFELQGFDRKFQRLMGEILLNYFWRWGLGRVNKCLPMYFVLDEVQNLQLKADTTLAAILTEGRKLKINAVLATQFLKPQYDRAAVARLLQCGTKIFFCPEEEETRWVAQCLDENNKKTWMRILTDLRKGESVVKGCLCNDAGQMVRTAVKLEALPSERSPKRRTVSSEKGVSTIAENTNPSPVEELV